MLSYDKSYKLVEQFYYDCLNFWKKEGKGGEAYELAKLDVLRITTNPFEPQGDKLNEQAKQDFFNKPKPC